MTQLVDVHQHLSPPSYLVSLPHLFPLTSVSSMLINRERQMWCLPCLIFPPADESAISIFSSLWRWWAWATWVLQCLSIIQMASQDVCSAWAQISICHFSSRPAVIHKPRPYFILSWNYRWPDIFLVSQLPLSITFCLPSFTSPPQSVSLPAIHFPLLTVSKSVICNFAAD